MIGVNPCVHRDQIPANFPDGARLTSPGANDGEWIEPGNSVICDPSGEIVAGPLRHEAAILHSRIDLSRVHAARRLFDPAGHYHRPDVFHLTVDTRPHRPVTLVTDGHQADGRHHGTDRADTPDTDPSRNPSPPIRSLQ